MDSSQLLASVAVALDKLQYRMKPSIGRFDEMVLRIMILGLRVVRTFLLCSTLLTEDNNMRMREDLGSLLMRVEDIVRKILDDHTPYQPFDFHYDMESCEAQMDNWYTIFIAYLKKDSTSPLANQIKALLDSVFETLFDYLIFKRSHGFDSEEQLQKIEALKGNITVMRHTIGFSSLLCNENQEIQCPLTNIEPLAISAAHFTLHIFSNIKGPNDATIPILSELLSEINHARSPHLYATSSFSTQIKRCLSHSIFVSCNKQLQTLVNALQLPGLTYIKTDSSRLLASVVVALEKLQYRGKQSVIHSDEMKLVVMIRGLRVVSTILLCSTQLTEENNFTPCSQKQKQDISRMREDLGSLLIGVEDVVHKILDDHEKYTLALAILKHSRELCDSTLDLNGYPFIVKMERCIVSLSSDLWEMLQLVTRVSLKDLELYDRLGMLRILIKRKPDIFGDDKIWDLTAATVYDVGVRILFQCSYSILFQPFQDNDKVIWAEVLEGKETMVDSLVLNVMKWSISSSDEVVGFESEKALIVDRLVAGLQKLQVVTVVGMAGLGKTTLATKVYRDSSVTRHFRVKARCSISQAFDRRKVLLELLNQIQPQESYSAMDENDLSLKLWRSLRQRKYLIFVDDVWDTEAFDLLKESLPNDSNQSRILLTSRHSNVVVGEFFDEKPLFLRHITMDESLELLRRKLFPAQKDWPSESVHKIAIEIAESCKGLPLTVVIVAGLLRTTDQEGWKDVLRTLRSSINSAVTEQCESTLELSYKHLPDYLKPCFLWFGAFPEDHIYSVKMMIWLWISEGLIRKIESKSLEDVARDYMNNLIARSLVMNVEVSSVGGVKTCRIHDLLHDFCKRKANEEYFLHVIKEDGTGSKEQGGVSSSEVETLLIDETENFCSVELRNLRRLCIYSKAEHLKWKVFCPRLRSLLFFPSTERYQELDLSYISLMFKLLRVLGINEVRFTSFPSEIGALVQLRYLAIRVDEHVGPAIGYLSNLETLILTSSNDVVSLPDALWNLGKLRHLYCENYFDDSILKLSIADSNSFKLLELQTLSTICVTDWSVLSKQLRKFPNIRGLKCNLNVTTDDRNCRFDLDKDGREDDSNVMDFSFLSQLESLSLIHLCGAELVFPENIKKLSLRGTELPWSKIASIAKLPNLEVLKLIVDAFVGDTWHVEEGEFPKLKFLRLDELELVKWTAAPDDVFPNLQKLELISCYYLEEIPECLQNVETLNTIEIFNCPDHLVGLLRSVEEFQKEMGNSSLQFCKRRNIFEE